MIAPVDTTDAHDDARLQEAYAAEQLQANFATLAVRQPVSWDYSTYSQSSYGGFSGAANYYTIDAEPALSIGIAIIDSGIQAASISIRAFPLSTISRTATSVPRSRPMSMAMAVTLPGSRSTHVGVAPSARLIGLKVLDANGQGTADHVIRAIEFAIANKDLLGINVLNMSLGHPIFESAATDPMVQAVEHASRAGLVVVLSAGNFGTNPTTGQVGYARCVARQCAVGHRGWLGEDVRQRHSRRRSHRALQLTWSVVA